MDGRTDRYTGGRKYRYVESWVAQLPHVPTSSRYVQTSLIIGGQVGELRSNVGLETLAGCRIDASIFFVELFFDMVLQT